MAELDLFLLWIGLFVGVFASVLVVLLLITLRKPLLAVSPAPPAPVLRDLAFRLRASGRLVKESTTQLEVGVNSLTNLKIHVRGTPRGTEVRYEVGATGVGWTIVLILAGFSGVGIIALGIALYIHFSASGFARNFVLPLVSGGPPLGTPPPPTVRTLLLEGLSEAQRLATEAAEYEREALQNGIGLILLGSLALFAFALIGLLPFTGFSPVALIAELAASIGIAVAGSFLVHARGAPKVRELESESALFAAAHTAEALGYALPAGPQPGLELLLRAAERSAYWREVRRRRKLWHDPVAGLTIFLLAYGAFLFSLLAVAIDILPVFVRAGLGLLGVGFLAGTVISIQRWRRQVREEDERDRQSWEARRGALETELWKILSG